MKVGRLKPRALTSYFLTSGHRRGLVVLIRFFYGYGVAKSPPLALWRFFRILTY
jgi:hypothetical protein